MKKAIILLCIVFKVSLMSFASQKVYVIHGFGGFKLHMTPLVNALKKEGFETVNYSYHSFSEDIDSVGLKLYNRIKTEKADTVSFVTHSMGALVVRSLYKNIKPNEHFPKIFRIVMIAPPNQGTQVADIYSGWLSSFLFGPNVEKLKTGPDSFASRLPIPDCETGIIAGMKGKKPWYNPSLKEDNDGNVSLVYTRLGNEKDFFSLHSTHNIMILKPLVFKQVVTFLRTAVFDKTQPIR